MEIKNIEFDKLINYLRSELDTMEYEHRHHGYEYPNEKYYIQVLKCVEFTKEYSMM